MELLQFDTNLELIKIKFSNYYINALEITDGNCYCFTVGNAKKSELTYSDMEIYMKILHKSDLQYKDYTSIEPTKLCLESFSWENAVIDITNSQFNAIELDNDNIDFIVDGDPITISFKELYTVLQN